MRPRQNPYRPSDSQSTSFHKNNINNNNKNDHSTTMLPEIADLKANQGDLRRLQKVDKKLHVSETQLNVQTENPNDVSLQGEAFTSSTTSTTTPVSS